MSRRFRTLVIVLLVLEGLYLLAANGFLNSDFGHRRLNRKPDKLSIEYQRAWTWFPGFVSVGDLALHGGGRRAEWAFRAKNCRMTIWLPSLVRRKFKLLRGGAQGAEVEVDVLPKSDKSRPSRSKRGWVVVLSGIAVDDFDKVRLGEYVLEGKGSARGAARFEVRGPMELDLADLSFDEAALRQGDEVVAERVVLDSRLLLDPYVVGEDTIGDLLAGTTGKLRLEADADGLDFLSSYLKKVPWLRIGGEGHLTADVEVTNGWLAPGSRLEFEGPTVAASYFGFDAEGEGRVEGLVTESPYRSELKVSLDQFSVEQADEKASLLVGENLSMTVVNDTAAIDRPAEGIEVSVHLPPATIPDLSAFSRYLPPATELSLTGGRGELSTDLFFSTITGSGHGDLHVSGESIQAEFRGLEWSSKLSLDAKLTDARFEAGTVEFSAVELAVDDVQIVRGGEVEEDAWWGHFEVPNGRWIRGSEAGEATYRLEASVVARLRDTGPITALLEQRVPKLAWFDRLLTVHDIDAMSDVALIGRDLQLAGLEVTGGKKSRVEMLGELDLSYKSASGVFFARWAKLSAAVSLDGKDRDWKLTGSRRWYEGEADAYRREASGRP